MSRTNRTFRTHAARALSLILAASAVAACAEAPRAMNGVQPTGSARSRVKPSELQTQVMDFADELMARVGQAVARIRRENPDPAAWRAAGYVRLTTATAAVVIASGQSPLASVLDMTVMVTLVRQAVEQRAHATFGESCAELLDALARSEERIWEIAATALSPDELESLRSAIREWRQDNADLGFVAMVRLNDFASLRASGAPGASTGRSSLLGLLYLDPLAGLDPTVREIEQSRLLGERIVFMGPRMIRIARWEAEQAVLDTAAAPDARALIDAATRASAAADSLAQAAAKLPEDVNALRRSALEDADARLGAQRKAAFDELARLLDEQRAGLLRDLEAAQAPIVSSLAELRSTLDSANALAVELRALAKEVGGLSSTFDPSAPPRSGGAPSGGEEGLAEYRAAISEASAAAKELTTLVRSVRETLADAMSDRAAAGLGRAGAEVRSLMDGLLWRSIVVVACAGIALFAALAAARAIPARRTS